MGVPTVVWVAALVFGAALGTIDPNPDPSLDGSLKDDTPVEEEGPPPRVAYSKALVNVSYRAEDKFDPKGMEHLYFLTNLFLQLINREQEMPPELGAMVSQELVQPTLDHQQAMRVVGKLEANWDVLLLHYIGLISLIVVGLLVAAIMPLSGLVFACCRCMGRCGAEDHYDKKRDPCKRVALGTFLSIVVVAILFGLVCTFVTNSRVEQGVQGLPMKLRVAVHDTRLYLNNTNTEFQNGLVKNYEELQTVLYNKLDRSGELVKTELARVTKAVAIDNLTAIANSLQYIREDLDTIRQTTLSLQQETSTLQNGPLHFSTFLPSLGDLSDLQSEDSYLPLERVKYLESDVLPQLPDIESKLREVSQLIANDTEPEVRRGKREFDSIATEIQNKVQRSIPEIKERIRKAGTELREMASKFRNQIREVDGGVKESDKYVKILQDYINEYAMYRYWGFFIVCALLLTITACFSFGIIFGCCGRRPDVASSCQKTTGASWLMCGVWLTFLFSVIIMVTTTALFVAGSATEIFVCNPLKDPETSEVVDLLSKEYSLKDLYPSAEAPHIVDIIRKCHHNESFYSVLHLGLIDNSLSKLGNYREKLKLDQKIAKLKKEINVETDIKILSRDAKRQLLELANSSIAIDSSWSDYTDIGMQRWLTSIHRHIQALKTTTEALGEKLKFNKTSLREAIDSLITQAEFAQNYLTTNGSKEVVMLVDRFTEDFLGDVDDYVAHVENAVGFEVGRCGPMSLVYNATTHTLCRDILLPFNGFWSSVGWCFILFIPCMILSVSLATLYRKTEPYPGPLMDSHESMYDAYAERDNVPLTVGYDKKQRRRSREYETHMSTNYSPDQAFAAPQISRSDYSGNDGGPPRYTSQPSLSPEYERPPPYYYPGPGQQYHEGPPLDSGSHPPQGPTNFLHGPTHWTGNNSQRTANLGGWKISPAYSRSEYDA